MEPVLAKLPPRRRTILFAPILLGAFLVVGTVLAFTTHNPYLTLVVSVPASVAGAWALVGWPEIRRKDGKPLVAPATRPFLFFPLAPLFALVLYVLVGYPLTTLGVPTAWLAVASLALALPGGCAIAYWLVGFPRHLIRPRETYNRIPPERRPFLFFPLAVVFFLVLYVGLGVLTTGLLAKSSNKGAILNLQPLILLPLCLVLACLFAYLLVGFPKPRRSPREMIPKVTGKHRPRLFAATFLLAGIPFTILVGVLLNAVAEGSSRRDAFLPAGLVLPLAVVLGYSLSFGVAALSWGTPRRWRQYEDYEPGLPPKARPWVHAATALAVALGITVVFGVAGLDIFYGLLVGGIAGLLVGLQLAGILPRLLARRHESTLLPDLPDRVKPLVLFPLWLLLSGLLFVVLTYAFPGFVAWNVVGSILVGLAVSVTLVEQGLLASWREERRREREKKKAWKARRKEMLREAEEATKKA